MTLFRGRRLRNRLEPVKVPARAKHDVDPDLERRREIARRICVDEGKNIDKPIVPLFVNELPIG